MHEALQLLIKRWRAEGIPLADPMSLAESQWFFEGLSISTGRDVWELYSVCGGFQEEHLDHNFFTLWPPERIAEMAHIARPPFLQFADFLIHSNRYAVAREDADTSSVWLYHQDEPTASYMIAPTLCTFLCDYASSNDPLGVLHDAC